MWKKSVKLILLCSLLLVLTACGDKKAGAESTTAQKEETQVDVDLTTLSSTMVYSEVNNMMISPGDYLGKTVKMKGNFAIYENEESGQIYYACLISDATACCSQGIEFVLKGEHNYPDDYPELDSEITVVGTFDTYQEGEYQYCQLVDAEME